MGHKAAPLALAERGARQGRCNRPHGALPRNLRTIAHGNALATQPPATVAPCPPLVPLFSHGLLHRVLAGRAGGRQGRRRAPGAVGRRGGPGKPGSWRATGASALPAGAVGPWPASGCALRRQARVQCGSGSRAARGWRGCNARFCLGKGENHASTRRDNHHALNFPLTALPTCVLGFWGM